MVEQDGIECISNVGPAVMATRHVKFHNVVPNEMSFLSSLPSPSTAVLWLSSVVAKLSPTESRPVVTSDACKASSMLFFIGDRFLKIKQFVF